MKTHSLYRPFALVLAASLIPACSDLDVGTQTSTTTTQNVNLQPVTISGSFVPAAGGTYDAVITWSDTNVAETNYRVDRANTPIIVPGGANVQFYKIIPANSTQYTFNMAGGQTLYFRVVAITSPFQSDHSNEVQITTPLLPTAPTLNTNLVSSTTIDLSWSAAGNGPITTYRIERQQDGGSWSTLTTVGGSTFAHSDSALPEDTQFCYRVYATNSDGEGPSSNTSCQSTPVGSSITLTTVTAGGGYVSLVVEPGGTEHISHWYQPTVRDVLYTSGTPGSYTTITADAGPGGIQNVGEFGTSIDIDTSNTLHISARHAEQGDLRYATGTTGGMTASTIQSTDDVGYQSNLRISPISGNINVLYTKLVINPSVSETLYWTFNAGASWSTPTIVFTTQNIPFVSFAVQSNDIFHATFLGRSGGTSTVYYAQKVGAAAWSVTPVTAIANAYQETMPAIAVDAAGFPHISFNGLDGTGFGWDLHHATNASGSWQVEPIDVIAGTDVGRYSSIAIDLATGRLNVSYVQASSGTLKYARKDPAATWVVKTLDPGGAVAEPTSIDVDAAGVIHIAYSGASSNLKTAVGSP